MFGEHHHLVDDMPNYKEKIHQLKLDDTHFSTLYSEYVELDKAVYRIEEGIETTSDEYLDGLKRQRVILKDELCDMLRRLDRSRKTVDEIQKLNEMLERREQLVSRLDSIAPEFRCGMKISATGKELQQENAEVLDRIAEAAMEELKRLEAKLAKFA